jgi:hypothetical protein
MTTDGIEAVYITTHNWGRTAKFFQALGFELDFATEHGSGLLRNTGGPYLFVAEIPEDQPVDVQLVLKTPADSFDGGDAVEVVTPFADTHFGTREMTVRDPDGRPWVLQAPVKR